MRSWFEDIAVGHVYRFGGMAVTRAEVIDFATRYDPQPFHLDDAAAAANPLFGRIAASGWHTAAMAMRMSVDFWREIGLSTLGGAGIEDLVWLRPVYPGDTLRVEAEALDARVLKSRPDVGLLKLQTRVFNQDDDMVMRQTATILVPRRPAQV